MDDAITRLQAMGRYHQEQLDRVNDALALLKDGNKIAAKVERQVRQVQTRVGRTPTPRPEISGTAIAREHANFDNDKPSNEIRRLVDVAKGLGRPISFGAMSAGYYLARKEYLTGKTSYQLRSGEKKAAKQKSVGRRMYQLRKSGDTAINRIRRLFLNGVTGPLTREQIQAQAKIADVTLTKHAAPAATARILLKMTQDRELKETPDGWVALKVQTPKVNNGAAHP